MQDPQVYAQSGNPNLKPGTSNLQSMLKTGEPGALRYLAQPKAGLASRFSFTEHSKVPRFMGNLLPLIFDTPLLPP